MAVAAVPMATALPLSLPRLCYVLLLVANPEMQTTRFSTIMIVTIENEAMSCFFGNMEFKKGSGTAIVQFTCSYNHVSMTRCVPCTDACTVFTCKT